MISNLTDSSIFLHIRGQFMLVKCKFELIFGMDKLFVMLILLSKNFLTLGTG